MLTARLFYLIGCWILLLCAVMILPLLIAVILGEFKSFQSLFSAFLFSTLIGSCFFVGFRSTDKVRTPRLTLLLPIVGAIFMAFVAGLPFFFLLPEEGLITAFYEGMSLLTTNGTSAYEGSFQDLHALTLWRALVAWVGGYVAVCVALSFLTAMNVGGLQLHQSPLPFGDSEAGYPRLRATALALYPAYIAATLLCLLLLWITGVPLFEALVLAFGTISSTGLLSNAESSVPGFWTQAILAIFMTLGVMNWDLHYARFKKRSLQVGRDIEFTSMAITILLITALVSFVVGSAAPAAIWQNLFATISAVSTTGVMPDGFLDDRTGFMTVGILLMLAAGIGGCTIGTGGGLKQLRAIVMYRTSRAEVDRLAHPHSVSGVSVDKVEIQRHDKEAVWLLLGSFVLVLSVGALLLAVLGIHFQDALSMAFTALTLSGPLVSVTDPFFGGFVGLTEADYLILSGLMLVGRVETSLLLALFAKSLWRG
jgi:trk system potassium uptake protein TrkH